MLQNRKFRKLCLTVSTVALLSFGTSGAMAQDEMLHESLSISLKVSAQSELAFLKNCFQVARTGQNLSSKQTLSL